MSNKRKKYLIYSLYASGMVLYAIIFLLGINNMAETKRNTEAIQRTTTSTNKLIKGQNEILASIKKVTKDTNLTAEQQTNIIICMLQVSVAERTTNTENNCRKQATAVALSVGTPAESSANSPDNSVSSLPSTQTTPKSNDSQSNNPPSNPEPGLVQKVINKVKDLL